jgi:uncharacterized protein (DUF2147 family)
MIKKYVQLFCLCAILFVNPAMAASLNMPTGLWLAHDDEGKPTGFIRITEKAGIYTGVIEKGLPEITEEQFCTACKGDKKDQPLIGMVIIKNVKVKGNALIGDEILDPFTGKTYRVKLSLQEGGQQMEVRGFIGFSLFGRTQIWKRAQNGQ